MQDFDTFESFKKETDRSLIAEIKGKRIMLSTEKPVPDSLELFGKPFLSKHSNGWIRVNFPYSLSAKNIKIKKTQAIFFARTFIVSTAFHYVILGNTPWYTHSTFRELGDDLKVKIYG